MTRPYDRPVLLKNELGRSFSDASSLLKISKEGNAMHASWHASWADIENDGDLDLFLSQWANPGITGEHLGAKIPQDSVLLINEEGGFKDVSEKYALSDFLSGENYVSSAFGDLNSDGYTDLFLSSFSRGRSKLLFSDRGQRFVASSVEFLDPGYTTSFIDLNHDSELELYQSGNAQLQHILDGVSKDKKTQAVNKIWEKSNTEVLKQREAFFDEVCAITTLGAAYGDVNNDGCHDFYFATGNPEPGFLLPSLFYLGVPEGESCSNKKAHLLNSEQIREPRLKAQGAVFFDYDRDGDQDLLIAYGGLWEGEESSLKVLRNDLDKKNHWLAIRLNGAKKNRFGLGSKIKVVFENSDGSSGIRTALMNNKTGFGSAPYISFIGLGNKAKTISRISVLWPGLKEAQEYVAKLDSYIELSQKS